MTWGTILRAAAALAIEELRAARRRKRAQDRFAAGPSQVQVRCDRCGVWVAADPRAMAAHSASHGQQ